MKLIYKKPDSKLITVPGCVLVFSYMIDFLREILTFHKYFKCSRFWNFTVIRNLYLLIRLCSANEERALQCQVQIRAEKGDRKVQCQGSNFFDISISKQSQ